MIIARLALQSLKNRWLTALLTVLAIGLSVMLFLGVEKIRNGARASFADTISGTDLIMGARSGSVQLMLYSVFRIGNATNNMSWSSFQKIAKRSDVAWIVPLSLGDSHRGFRVLGTTRDYFKYVRFRQKQNLEFMSGKPFDDIFDAVLGADVAAALGYKLDDPLIVAHGLGRVSFSKHKDKPFRVAGILAKTGTPIDRTVHVSLKAIEAIHIDWQTGARRRGGTMSTDQVRALDLQPKSITAALIGLKSKLSVFRVQRAINEFKAEPLTATLPGVALQELWQLIGQAETALKVVSAMVILTALLGMVTMILTTLNERRREMAILRSVGAGPGTILGMMLSEAAILTGLGVVLGMVALYLALGLARGFIDAQFGIYLNLSPPDMHELMTLGGIVIGGILAGLLPAIRAYRMSLVDGMLVRN